MRAILYDRWGGPEVLRLAEIETPSPQDDEVLIAVRAASVNAWDLDLISGKRYFVRPEGFAKGPKRLGFDLAGVVEAVGKDVTRFRVGDEVFGDIAWDGPGTLADYCCVKQAKLALKPDGMSFEQAAAMPQAGLLALQGLRALRAGAKVLINGAGGGVGTFGIQIAKLQGAEVTGVDSAQKLEAMRAAGADHVVDYRAEDFTGSGRRYDYILDAVANRPLSAYARALNRGGRLSVVGGTEGVLLKVLVLGPLFGLFRGKQMRLLIYKPTAADLEWLAERFVEGTLVPVIDSRFPLEQSAEAVRRLSDGHACGKVVVSLAG
ncbi:MAG TPA: NAD(P)-dependent alcohol dehydrogenase [Devosiaceae bacterium]|jgi:NADPH:quinone reductase-like Zn-dependent oxidoreductase|nr:NAD(P)-dependent alcohol dehydrogenase [Devosiaceae bacterium]